MNTRAKLLASVAVVWVVGLIGLIAWYNSDGMKVREDPPEDFVYRGESADLDLVVDGSALAMAVGALTIACLVLAVLVTVWTQPKPNA